MLRSCLAVCLALAAHAHAACGDCNQDSATNILDSLTAAQAGAGLASLPTQAFLECNVTGTLGPAPTGSVDILDALRIAQFAAGLPVALQCDLPVWPMTCGATSMGTLAVASGASPPDLTVPGATRFFELDRFGGGATGLEITLTFAAGDDFDLLVGDVGTMPGDTNLASYAHQSLGATPETVRIDAASMPPLASYVAAGQPIAIAVHRRTGSGTSFTLESRCTTPPPAGPAIQLTVDEPLGVPRVGEPVDSGVPFPQGMLTNPAACYLEDSGGALVPAQFRVLEEWPDRSIQWLLVHFQTDVAAAGSSSYQLRCDGLRTNPMPAAAIQVMPGGTIQTGAAEFTTFQGLPETVAVRGTSLIAGPTAIELTTAAGAYSSRGGAATVTVLEQGPLKLVHEIRGNHMRGGGNRLGNYTAWVTYFAGSPDVHVRYRLENEQAMGHPGNFWDLGASGALWFDDLSLRMQLAAPRSTVTFDGTGGLSAPAFTTRAAIYQDSSGKPNWNSQNHIDGNYQVQTSVRGYQVLADGAPVSNGDHAAGWMEVAIGSGGAVVAVRDFWQAFPKSLAVDGTTLEIGLWPGAFAFDHEVQGGEHKTHDILLAFEDDLSRSNVRDRARAFQSPLFARADAQWVADSKALGDFIPAARGLYPIHEALCDTIHTPQGSNPRSAVSQRDVIDEYGWRNWGDMMADHETDGYVIGWDTPISHYNNQYDAAYGSLLSYFRTGDRGFLDFGAAYARHTADIDVNHAPNDGIYAGGHFWHTTHDVHALTSTHRTWSVDHQAMYPGQPWLSGGGPGLGHMYVRGLWALYHMRGDLPALEAALEVADFAVGYYAGTSGGARGSRESGNLLITLIPAYRHTGDARYYTTMMQLINANGASFDWSGNGGMYPHGLGEFLRMKTERGEAGDPDYDIALNALLGNCDQAVMQSLGGQSWPYVHYTAGLCLAHRYAPAAHPNKATYKTFAGQLWNEILPATPDYPSAKPLSYWIALSHTWPYFDQGGR